MKKIITEDILDRISDAFFSLDGQWCVTHLNKEAERIFQVTRAEIIGKKIWDQAPDIVGTDFYHYYLQAMESQEAVRFQSFFMPFEKWYSVHVYPDDDGLSIFFIDITEQKKTNDYFIESQKQLKTIFEHSGLGIALIDRSGRFLKVNPKLQELFGYTEQELLQKTFIDLTHPDDVQANLSLFHEKDSYTMEKRYIRKMETSFGRELL